MIELRPFAALGHSDHGWLDARYHFSFGDYRDPARMNWGRLRVWNDDRIAPGTGFAPHSHRDMEIITYVRSGAISHEDNLGNKGRTQAGDVQVMSAGTGITHAEYNHEEIETSLFQIWILPDQVGHAPSWGTRPFPKAERAGKWIVLASGAAQEEGALPIHADARVLGASLAKGDVLDFTSSPDRHLYLVPVTGSVRIENCIAHARDGVAISGVSAFRCEAVNDCELVLVETA